jgi:hypothetical protein
MLQVEDNKYSISVHFRNCISEGDKSRVEVILHANVIFCRPLVSRRLRLDCADSKHHMTAQVESKRKELMTAVGKAFLSKTNK